MKARSLLAFVLAALLGSGLALGQSSKLTAIELAQRIDRHYNSLHSLEVHFTQHYEGMGMNRNEAGVLLLKKPGKMRWAYSQPQGKLFVLDGKNGYFYSPGDTEVQRVPVKKLDDMRSPLRLLLGHAKLEQELTGLAIAPQADGTYVLTGIPRGLEKRVASFSVTATAEGVIRAMRIEETDGITNAFIFSDEKPDAAAPDAEFVFNVPPGVNVVEGLPPV
ncbi:MAG TPA: outer membrane lipoprotein chaperone LolA [Silvibacterium sp.]|nr:outer membrane lipoprotein chaperone LolA [Silvibacterium sp.]